MKLPAAAWASLQELAARTTSDILSLDFFVEDTSEYVAYMDSDGVHLSRLVVENDAANVAVYFAHEWFHQVVWCPQIAHRFSADDANLLTDIKINSLLNKRLGYRADRVKVPGHFIEGVENLTIEQIARRYWKKLGLGLTKDRFQNYPQIALPQKAATRWLARWLSDEPTLRPSLTEAPRAVPSGTRHLPRVSTSDLAGFFYQQARGEKKKDAPYWKGPIEPTWALAYGLPALEETSTQDQASFLVDTLISSLGRADDAHQEAVTTSEKRVDFLKARRWLSSQAEEKYQKARESLRKARTRPKLVDLLLKTKVELHHLPPPKMRSLGKASVSRPRFTDRELVEQARWVLKRPLRQAQAAVRQLQQLSCMFPGAVIPQRQDSGASASEYSVLVKAQQYPTRFWRFIRNLEFFRQVFSSHRQSSAPNDLRPTLGTYEFGADLSRALPSSLTSLANEHLRLGFLADLAQGTLLQAAATSSPRQNISLLVDCSGSMYGYYPTVLAFALALAEMMKKEGRHLSISLFDERIVGQHLLTGAFDLPALLSLLYAPTFGGTDFDQALQSSFSLAKSLGWDKCTHVLVTDGDDTISQQTVRQKPSSHSTLALLVSGRERLEGVDRSVLLEKLQGGLVKAARSL